MIRGVTLWDRKSLNNDLDIRSQLHTDLKFSSSDSLSDKCSLLDVNASLKASFMCGLVEVGGSAKYLRDTKSSNQQSRVTMHYRETTKFEQLTMTQLSHFTYPQVFEQKTATHVVTAVLYGAQAFMVFERTYSDDDNKQKIEGELDVMVKSIPGFSIEGKGAVQMKDDDKKKAEKISCTFHGDFHLEQNPTTYMEALDVYLQLPTLLKKNNESGVPIKVWLYPLSLLDTTAARLVREISTNLVSNTEAVMERLEEAERRCNDLFRRSQLNGFSDIKERLQSFQESLSIYKLVLQKELCKVLPDIRGGGKEEQSLEDILKIHNKSPFNASSLNQWLDNTKLELDLLSSCTKCLDQIRTEDSNGLKTVLVNPDIDVVVCLNFTSLKYKDTYLTNLNDFLKSDAFQKLDGKITSLHPASVKNWFEDPNAIAKMRVNLSNFRSLSEANKNDKKMCFIISAISDPSSPGSSIYLYEQGKLTDKQLKSKLKPSPPIVRSVNENTVSMKLQKFPTGGIPWYSMEYKEVKPEEKEWLVKTIQNQNFTLTGLESGKQYLIRYRIVDYMTLMTSKASDTVSAEISSAPPVCVGGKGGDEFTFITRNRYSIHKISISYKLSTLSTIQVTFHCGHTMNVGNKVGNAREEIVLDINDKILSAKLWPNRCNNRAGGLEFVVKKMNGLTACHRVKCNDLGEPVSIDVKSGKCYGITGRSGDDIDALGLYFS
ncbi:verrucotoxin subunit beta-like [Misgurnus anguillicaudatus]|uniref:verrucotoxin subunit beta-like n=1 Tax=Misgurnus anguillicaudatus TaxID=75329 RepID=UPI003CCF1DDE